MTSRFWEKVNKSGECWLWTAGKTSGYGVIRVDGKNFLAHRLSWEWANGSIPDGMCIDHICLERSCVNPKHLRVVTRALNNQNKAGARSDNRCGVRGVRLHPGRRKPFQARAGLNGRQYSNGYHATVEDAAAAALEIRRRILTHSER